MAPEGRDVIQWLDQRAPGGSNLQEPEKPEQSASIWNLLQGWKLQAVGLFGTGKNRAGQVKILDTFPKKRLKFWKLLSVCMPRTGKNSAGQVVVFDTFPKERQKYFVISTPVLVQPRWIQVIMSSKQKTAVWLQVTCPWTKACLVQMHRNIKENMVAEGRGVIQWLDQRASGGSNLRELEKPERSASIWKVVTIN